MIWATISSRSCFCWLYRAFPSLVTKNIVNLLLIFTDPLVMSMSKVVSCVVGRGCLLWPVPSGGKTVSYCHAPFCTKGQICLLLQVSLDFLLLHSHSLWYKRHLFLVLILEGLVTFHKYSSSKHYSLEALQPRWQASDIISYLLPTSWHHCSIESCLKYSCYLILSRFKVPDVIITMSLEWCHFERL